MLIDPPPATRPSDRDQYEYNPRYWQQYTRLERYRSGHKAGTPREELLPIDRIGLICTQYSLPVFSDGDRKGKRDRQRCRMCKRQTSVVCSHSMPLCAYPCYGLVHGSVLWGNQSGYAKETGLG